MLQNKVVPSTCIFSLKELVAVYPSLTEEDDILLVIKGLTDFTLQDIYGIINLLTAPTSQVGRVTIVSNVDLGYIGVDYYFYVGDLFYGNLYKVVNGKRYELESTGKQKPNGKGKNKKDLTLETDDKFTKNRLFDRYKVYLGKDANMGFYENEVNFAIETVQEVDEKTLSRIKTINLFT
jgi:hypothetical protein